MTTPQIQILLCPHCYNETSHKLILTHRLEPTWYQSNGEPCEGPPTPVTYLGFACSTCNDLSLYLIIDDDDDTMRLEYPKSHILEASIPLPIRKNYAEAKLLQKRSPNAFAVMIRRSLEALCDDKNVRSGTLRDRLKALTESKEMPPILAEASSALRLLGNAGAHHTNEDITIPQTWKIDKLFLAVVEYIYIAPKLIREFNDTQKKNTQTGNQE